MDDTTQMLHDHVSPRVQNFVGSGDEHKQASAAAMGLHTINFNSFVGFGGSDLGNRG